MADEAARLERALAEIEDLRARLDEAEEALGAIRRGEVDAVIVTGPQGEQVYTLTGAERTYRILVEAMNEGALVLSPEGNVVYCNRTFAAMLGAPIYDVLGHVVYDFVAPEDVEPLKSMLSHAPMQSGRREICLVNVETGCLSAFMSVANLDTEEGPAVSAVVTDLTETKRTEAELALYREHLEELVAERTRELAVSKEQVTTILESISDGFLAYDRDWRYVYINAEAERQIQMTSSRTRRELLGKVVWEEFPELVETDLYRIYQQVMAERKTVVFEQFVEGSGRWYQVRAYPSELGLSAYSEDITEARRVEQELLQAHADAERRTAELESFVSSIADGVVLHDAEGNAVLVNEAAQRILGGNPASAIDDRVRQYRVAWLDGTPMKPEETASARALRGETVKDLRYSVLGPGGERRTISVGSSPVRAADGSILGATTIFRDVTDLAGWERQREEMFEREHRIAEMLQQTLIPSQIPYQVRGVSVAAKYQPALKEAQVGGDFYDIFTLGGDKIGVLIGDVAGKGLDAAIRVAEIRHAIRSYAYLGHSPAEVLSLANEALLHEDENLARMLTAFLAEVDPSAGTITYANAGHEPPLVCGSGGVIDELSVTGIMLGVIRGAEYRNLTRAFGPGETIVMFTDGITEARHDGSILLEKEGVIAHLTKMCGASPEEVADALLKVAVAHAGGALQDDAAIVVLSKADGRDACPVLHDATDQAPSPAPPRDALG